MWWKYQMGNHKSWMRVLTCWSCSYLLVDPLTWWSLLPDWMRPRLVFSRQKRRPGQTRPWIKWSMIANLSVFYTVCFQQRGHRKGDELIAWHLSSASAPESSLLGTHWTHCTIGILGGLDWHWVEANFKRFRSHFSDFLCENWTQRLLE